MEADPLRHHFTLVFDRAGYGPDFRHRMKTQRVARLTYHPYPGEDWAEEVFQARPVQLANGQVVEMKLAERGTSLSNRLWVREFRRLTARGHQTAMLATDYRSAPAPLAAALFARWSPENFFHYARQHYHLERLVDYATEAIAETIRVVNPAHRRLEGQVRSATGKLNRLLAQFGAMNLDATIEPEQVEPFLQKKTRVANLA